MIARRPLLVGLALAWGLSGLTWWPLAAQTAAPPAAPAANVPPPAPDPAAKPPLAPATSVPAPVADPAAKPTPVDPPLAPATTSPATPAPVVAKPGGVDFTADQLDFDVDHRDMLVGKGHVIVKVRDITLTADEATFNTETYNVTAAGHVLIKRPNQSWSGDSIKGNLNEKSFSFGKYEAMVGRWQVWGREGVQNAQGELTLHHASLTACEDWRFTCSRFVYQPNGDYMAYNVLYKIYGVPVFYVPYVWGNTNRDDAPVSVEFGHESDWGFYLIVSKEFRLTPELTMRPELQYRTLRGFALADKAVYTTEHTKTKAMVFEMQDNKPQTDHQYKGRNYTYRFPSETGRYRAQVNSRANYFEQHLELRLKADYLSDADLMYELFRDEYDVNPQPVSLFDAAYGGDRYEVSLQARARLNEYETVVERLPELRLDMARQRLGDSGFFYQSASSLAYLQMVFPKYQEPRTDGLADARGYSTTRLDTAHFIYYPMELGWLNVVPRLGLRATYYEASSDTNITADQLGSTFSANARRTGPAYAAIPYSYTGNGGSQLRLAGEAGVELSFKSYRTWSHYQNRWLQLNGFRHVVEPYLNYTFIPEPTVSADKLYFFDHNDYLTRSDFVRLGARQRFETRRNDQIYTFARLENYTDFYVQPINGQQNLGDFGTLAEFDPHPSWSVWIKSLMNMSEPDFNALELGTTVGPQTGLHASISYLLRNTYRTREGYSMGSDLTQILSTNPLPTSFLASRTVALTLYYPLNKHLRTQATWVYDLQLNKLAYSQYEILREFGCWWLALRATESGGNFGVSLVWHLKGVDSFEDKPTVATTAN